jgi:hypothetical protein
MAIDPNESDITFNQPVVVASYVMHFVPVIGAPFNIPGSFTVAGGGTYVEFDASPPQVPQQGTMTVTVMIDQGTKCAQTITWSYTIVVG